MGTPRNWQILATLIVGLSACASPSPPAAISAEAKPTHAASWVDPPIYDRVGEPVSDEVLQRAFARCKVQMQSIMVQSQDNNPWARLAMQITVRDNCMRAEGFVRRVTW